MAENVYTSWIPEEFSGNVIQRVNQVSAIEALARREPMSTNVRSVPRSGGVDVESIPNGGVYGEDTTANDGVLLTARKFGKAIRIADEDLKDSTMVDIIATKQIDWATSYGKMLDNSSVGVTGATNGTTIPFSSVYYQLAHTNATTGYTANSNITQTGSGGVSYDNISAAWGSYEQGDYFDLSDTIVIAHSSFRAKFRGVKDNYGRPIFQENAHPGIDTLFGAVIHWSTSLKTSAVATPNPVGNPLMLVGNKQYLILGVRSGPESRVAGADSGAAFLTDEALLKMRSRRGFNVGHEKALSILEDNH